MLQGSGGMPTLVVEDGPSDFSPDQTDPEESPSLAPTSLPRSRSIPNNLYKCRAHIKLVLSTSTCVLKKRIIHRPDLRRSALCSGWRRSFRRASRSTVAPSASSWSTCWPSRRGTRSARRWRPSSSTGERRTDGGSSFTWNLLEEKKICCLGNYDTWHTVSEWVLLSLEKEKDAGTERLMVRGGPVK